MGVLAIRRKTEEMSRWGTVKWAWWPWIWLGGFALGVLAYRLVLSVYSMTICFLWRDYYKIILEVQKWQAVLLACCRCPALTSSHASYSGWAWSVKPRIGNSANTRIRDHRCIANHLSLQLITPREGQQVSEVAELVTDDGGWNEHPGYLRLRDWRWNYTLRTPRHG